MVNSFNTASTATPSTPPSIPDTIPRELVKVRGGHEFLVNFLGEPIWFRNSERSNAVRVTEPKRITDEISRVSLWSIDRPPTLDHDAAWRVSRLLRDWGIDDPS